MPSRPPTTSWPHRLTPGCSTRVHSLIKCVIEMMSCAAFLLLLFPPIVPPHFPPFFLLSPFLHPFPLPPTHHPAPFPSPYPLSLLHLSFLHPASFPSSSSSHLSSFPLPCLSLSLPLQHSKGSLQPTGTYKEGQARVLINSNQTTRETWNRQAQPWRSHRGGDQRVLST